MKSNWYFEMDINTVKWKAKEISKFSEIILDFKGKSFKEIFNRWSEFCEINSSINGLSNLIINKSIVSHLSIHFFMLSRHRSLFYPIAASSCLSLSIASRSPVVRVGNIIFDFLFLTFFYFYTSLCLGLETRHSRTRRETNPRVFFCSVIYKSNLFISQLWSKIIQSIFLCLF